MGLKQIAKGVTKGAVEFSRLGSPEIIYYWSHGDWFSLRKESGELIERHELKRPRRGYLVKGGRSSALKACENFWGKLGEPVIDNSKDESGSEAGFVEPGPESLEPEREPEISEKPEPISPVSPRISESRGPGISRSFPRRGLPR